MPDLLLVVLTLALFAGLALLAGRIGREPDPSREPQEPVRSSALGGRTP